MKIVILGAGALGSIIAGHLARAGEEVTIIARGDRAAYLQQHGITLTGLADFTVPAAVATQPQMVREADVLVVAVKTYDTEPALESVSHLKVGSVLSIQNGVLKDEQLAHTLSMNIWSLANFPRAFPHVSRPLWPLWSMPVSVPTRCRRFRPWSGPNTRCS